MFSSGFSLVRVFDNYDVTHIVSIYLSMYISSIIIYLSTSYFLYIYEHLYLTISLSLYLSKPLFYHSFSLSSSTMPSVITYLLCLPLPSYKRMYYPLVIHNSKERLSERLPVVLQTPRLSQLSSRKDPQWNNCEDKSN